MFRSLFAISDEQAMWRVQTQDDHGAFALLVERWREKIRQLCIRMTGNPHIGDDLAQEVFARVFDKRGDFKGTSRFSTWLWRIAVNRCQVGGGGLQRESNHGDLRGLGNWHHQHQLVDSGGLRPIPPVKTPDGKFTNC